MIGLVPRAWLNWLGIPPWIWNPLSVSLRAALEATIVVAVVGIALAYLLAKGRFPGRNAIEILFSMPMALPPTVVGWYLLTAMGGPGPIRNAEVRFLGHPLTFTFTGIVDRADHRVLPLLPALLTRRDLEHRPPFRTGCRAQWGFPGGVSHSS